MTSAACAKQSVWRATSRLTQSDYIAGLTARRLNGERLGSIIRDSFRAGAPTTVQSAG
ncbi:hypothetical protein [Bradyrhizobium embrapense]|uniref:hypothetical protein n=1 Tax=Bradyrhizobium embrapense TaxID=630921 RepID=UPI0012F4AAA7|nr:hypothetical protein [Bradyrhizobium embrapense]